MFEERHPVKCAFVHDGLLESDSCVEGIRSVICDDLQGIPPIGNRSLRNAKQVFLILLEIVGMHFSESAGRHFLESGIKIEKVDEEKILATVFEPSMIFIGENMKTGIVTTGLDEKALE